MFKSVAVLVVFVAVAYARPGYLEAYPPAVSHVSRIDVHAKPLVATYGSVAPYYGSPVGYGTYGVGHGYGHGYGYPLAHSYVNRVDLHEAPVVVGGLGHGYYGYGGLGHGGYGWDY